MPKDIWLRILIPFCGSSQLLQLEKAGKFFYHSINLCDQCESKDGNKRLERADLSPFCKSTWTLLAKATKFTHEEFSDVSCRITKHLMARVILRDLAQNLIPGLFYMLCKRNNHVLTRTKKSQPLVCTLCNKGIELKDVCGHKNRKSCGEHRQLLCAYPSAKD